MGREGLWLEGRALKCMGGEGGTLCMRQTCSGAIWGQTHVHIWGLSIWALSGLWLEWFSVAGHKLRSGRKKEPKPKLFGPDIFQWGRGLPRERVGAKKFDTSLETSEIKLFGRDIPGFCRDIPGAPEKFEKKRFGFNFPSLLEVLRGGLLAG